MSSLGEPTPDRADPGEAYLRSPEASRYDGFLREEYQAEVERQGGSEDFGLATLQKIMKKARDRMNEDKSQTEGRHE